MRDDQRVVSGGIVAVERATVRFGGLVVLDEVSLSCGAAQVVCVRGSNGAGKTTLLRLLAGVLRPSAGTRVGPRTCAYVPASLTPPSLSAQGWLRGVRARRREDPFAALEQLEFRGDLSRSCRTLSFGNLRKLLLADALSSAASLIVIDEAPAALDAEGRAGMARLIVANRDRGAAVVVAAQERQAIEEADIVVWVGNRVLRETTAATRSEDVELTFRGPSSHRNELTRAAEEFGYRPS